MVGEDVREKIVKASMKVFSKYGFFKAPVAMIAEEAGVSKGLVFWYFRRKDDLILEVAFRSLPLDVAQKCLSQKLRGAKLLECIGEKYLEKYSDPVLRNLLLHTIASETVYPQVRRKIKKLCERVLRKVALEAYGEDTVEARVAVRTFFGSLLCYILRPPKDISGREYLNNLMKILKFPQS